MFIAKSWITRILNAANPHGDAFAPSDEEFDQGFIRVGFETEGYEPIPETTGPLVVGRVETIEELTGFKKPIRHCMVNVGDANGSGELQSIVCGARNFKEGDLVVVSLPGCVLPGDFKISARETYGRMSAGMICSAAELGMVDKQTSGIMVLDEGLAEPGTSAYELLGLNDTVFDVNITPDRGYALSARGLAREVASSSQLNYVDIAADPSVAGIDLPELNFTDGLLDITVEPETKARRFGLVKVSGIDPTAQTPMWMQRELFLSGQRPVNVATDVTNYVMMLLGQPMHAFDADLIAGGLLVRNAKAGETLETLDHTVRKLQDSDVVICDDNGIQSLAGVMGGLTSEIGDNTTNVYFEAANWDPITVARTCRKHKLSSEASRRFERGVDPALVEVALKVAAHLLVSIAGGTVDSKWTIVGETPAMAPIQMPADTPEKIAGKPISAEVAVQRLEEVGCAVENKDGVLTVTPPTWRGDLTMKCDLVEEVLRLEGLEDIPSVTPQAPAGRGLTLAQKRRRNIGHALAYQGFVEIIPTPFMSNTVLDAWGLDADDPRRNTVKVANPLESDYGLLATTLLPALCDVVARNVSRGHADVQLFSVAQTFHKRTTEPTPMLDVSKRPSVDDLNRLFATMPAQPLYAATVGVGRLAPVAPDATDAVFTWADAIESARNVARATGVELHVEQAEQLPWHPGRCAALKVGDKIVGYAGELHPKLLKEADLPARLCAMEMDLTEILHADATLPAPVLSPYPALLQDVALVVDADTPAEELRRVLLAHAGELIESVELFDIYTSEKLGENKKSLAFALKFRAPDRTLTDEETNAAKNAAVEVAKERFGAEMRA